MVELFLLKDSEQTHSCSASYDLHTTSLGPTRESDYGIFCRMLDSRTGRERVFWYTAIKTKEKIFCCAIFHILRLNRWFVFLLSASPSTDFFNNSY